MESIKEFPRGITDQAISGAEATAEVERSPWSGPTSDSIGGVPGKADITVTSLKLQAASAKLQAPGDKLQATSFKRQAKRQATSAVCHPNRQATGKAFRDDRS